MKRLVVAMIAALGMACALPSAALADKDPIYTPALSRVAVGGYDAVAYFTQGKAVPGKTIYQTTYLGAVFQFSTPDNLERFKATPAAYVPQYGGYCAWAVANGYTARGDPKHWKIVNSKLYLNYDADVQAKWSADIPGFIDKADSNWPAVLAK